MSVADDIREMTREDMATLLAVSPNVIDRMPMYFGLTYAPDDEPAAIGGLIYDNEKWWAFCDDNGYFEKHPVTAWRFSKIVLEAAQQAGIEEIHADMAQWIPTAPHFLKRLGFVQTDNPKRWILWLARQLH